MQINLETVEKHTIQSYSDSKIKIDTTFYEASLIISRNEIISSWPIHTIQELAHETLLEPLLQFKPEIIIIGQKQRNTQVPIAVLQHLSKLRIGLECMSIGAASRTFNVLLSEHRIVVAGIIF